MKILHVAVFDKNSTNVWQANALESLGNDVYRYDYRKQAVLLGNYNRDDDLINLCKKYNPEVILFAKCNNMSPNVVKLCKEIGHTIMWMPDGSPHFNKNYSEKLVHCDIVFCSTKEMVDLAKSYCNRCYRLQGGFDSKIHVPMNLPKTRRAVFIGEVKNYIYPYRKEYYNIVKFEIIQGIYGLEHSKIVSETKVNINLSNGQGVSNRLYKLLASNGFVISTPYNSMMEDFTPGKDFIIADSPSDMKEKVEYYASNDNERETIASSGYKTVQKYNDINYAKRILEEVNKL